MSQFPPSFARTSTAEIQTDGDKIKVIGAFGGSDLRRLLAAIYNTTTKRGYRDIVLDFNACDQAFAPALVPIACVCLNLLRDGIDTSLVLPENVKLKRLFLNTNWAHFIDPQKFEMSTFDSPTHVPVLNYVTSDEHVEVVNKIMDGILGAVPGLSRDQLKAFEWSLNEITDNVINHAQSKIGGFVQLTAFTKARRRVEYVVCDGGIGIPNSLRETHTELRGDAEALEKAIREGITRDTSTNMGNGLFGSYQIAHLSGGYFHIHSGWASLYFDIKTGLHVKKEDIPFPGTLVVCGIGYSEPLILEKALRFRSGPHNPPFDYIEKKYESDDEEEVIIRIVEETKSFGSRESGRVVKTKIKNVLCMSDSNKIILDFSNVPLITSSFADEVIGKLFVELGPMRFMSAVQFRNLDPTVHQLIDRAISQRAASV